MKLIADYHTHTIYSHGKGTVEENVVAARKKGLKRIAISDHGFSHIGYGVRHKDFARLKDDIKRVQDKYSDIEILLGIESNLTSLDGHIDIPDSMLDEFDIILMGFHKAVCPNSYRDGYNLFVKNALNSIGLFDKEKLRMMNTRAMVKAIEKYPIDIITHPGAKIDIDSKILAETAAGKDVALEINASHGYMTVEYAKIALEAGALFVISSDAHVPDRVGDFIKGINIAKDAGVPPQRIINTLEFNNKQG